MGGQTSASVSVRMQTAYGHYLSVSNLIELRTVKKIQQIVCSSRVLSEAEAAKEWPSPAQSLPSQPEGNATDINDIQGKGTSIPSFSQLILSRGITSHLSAAAETSPNVQTSKKQESSVEQAATRKRRKTAAADFDNSESDQHEMYLQQQGMIEIPVSEAQSSSQTTANVRKTDKYPVLAKMLESPSQLLKTTNFNPTLSFDSILSTSSQTSPNFSLTLLTSDFMGYLDTQYSSELIADAFDSPVTSAEDTLLSNLTTAQATTCEVTGESPLAFAQSNLTYSNMTFLQQPLELANVGNDLKPMLPNFDEAQCETDKQLPEFSLYASEEPGNKLDESDFGMQYSSFADHGNSSKHGELYFGNQNSHTNEDSSNKHCEDDYGRQDSSYASDDCLSETKSSHSSCNAEDISVNNANFLQTLPIDAASNKSQGSLAAVDELLKSGSRIADDKRLACLLNLLRAGISSGLIKGGSGSMGSKLLELKRLHQRALRRTCMSDTLSGGNE